MKRQNKNIKNISNKEIVWNKEMSRGAFKNIDLTQAVARRQIVSFLLPRHAAICID